MIRVDALLASMVKMSAAMSPATTMPATVAAIVARAKPKVEEERRPDIPWAGIDRRCPVYGRWSHIDLGVARYVIGRCRAIDGATA